MTALRIYKNFDTKGLNVDFKIVCLSECKLLVNYNILSNFSVQTQERVMI